MAEAHPLDQWPVAEAGLRLDAMKAKIAEITHPWPLVREPAPDLGGQHLISVFTMRNEVTEGARRVLSLTAQIAIRAGRRRALAPNNRYRDGVQPGSRPDSASARSSAAASSGRETGSANPLYCRNISAFASTAASAAAAARSETV